MLLYKLRWFKTISCPEKSREILVKQAYNVTIILYMCLISPISCVRLMNEWQSVDRSQSRVACRDFLELWLLKKQRKIRISRRQCHSKFPRKGSKTKYEKKNLKLVL